MKVTRILNIEFSLKILKLTLTSPYLLKIKYRFNAFIDTLQLLYETFFSQMSCFRDILLVFFNHPVYLSNHRKIEK